MDNERQLNKAHNPSHTTLHHPHHHHRPPMASINPDKMLLPAKSQLTICLFLWHSASQSHPWSFATEGDTTRTSYWMSALGTQWPSWAQMWPSQLPNYKRLEQQDQRMEQRITNNGQLWYAPDVYPVIVLYAAYPYTSIHIHHQHSYTTSLIHWATTPIHQESCH